jgi:hypothetical protein
MAHHLRKVQGRRGEASTRTIALTAWALALSLGVISIFVVPTFSALNSPDWQAVPSGGF